MDTKHTPTPWFAKRAGFSTIYIESRIRPGVLQEVAACGPTEGGSDEQDANAAFIVNAANSHEQMKAALIAVRNEVAGGTKPFSSDSYLPAHIVEQIDAALAAAEA